ncbi:autotransporter outer membrane beta-barrel domain-containing protein [Sphingomonas sp. Tas61C01]|uniref:autotransporter outer membrane beta-barrel domain-containing protein n=1 Tax=Sphingomonas sp. Tas61C01 TaxID=3458297 RepID=UPI00403EF204
MNRLLLATSATIAITAASAVSAQTVIDTKRTTQVRTSTVRNGSADAISIVAAGSVVPTGGAAVVIDSDHGVTNAGTIQVSDADGATGILAQAGVKSGITNSGKIIVDEAYTATDTDKDGDLDGAFAKGTGRTGIRTAGAFTGTIANSGEISVEGNDSAGIYLGGPLTGSINHSGKTAVVGDRSVGVRVGAVTGAVTLGGSITAIGRDAVGARLDGDVAGALIVEGLIGSSGYRYSTPPADASKLDADDLLQGGPALLVAGDVTGGIKLSGATGKAADVVSYGAAPGFQIGAAGRAVTIGAVAGTTPAAGLVIDGKVTGSGVYSGVAATGLAIGGLGGAVTITGGVAVGGTVQATATGASATGIRFGTGSATPELRVTGAVTAAGGGAIATQSIAVLIDTGAAVPVLRNGGTIRAGATGATAIGILDRTGNLTLVENSGAIGAAGADAARSVAIDLSANTSGAMIRQTAPTSGAAPAIAGAIRFGTGSDRLDLAAGSVSGDVTFGAGDNRLDMTNASSFAGSTTFGSGADTIAIGGTATYAGTADFAGGGQDVLAITGKGVFAGKLVNAGTLAVSVAAGGGTFAASGGTTIGSLALGDQSVLSVALDKANPAANLIQVNGATTIAANSKLQLRVAGGVDIAGRYVVLRSGTLTGAQNLTLATTAVPFLYKGAIVAASLNEIAVDVVRKAKGELGLDRGATSAFDSIDTAIGTDAKLAAAVRGIYDGDSFRAAVDQMLPNYAGGVFESVTLASRAAAAQVLEPAGSFSEEGGWGVWLTPVGYDGSKAARSTASYDVHGWGLSGGLERKTQAGNFGASLAYLKGRASEGIAVDRVDHSQYELAGFWRGHWGGFAAQVRGSAAFVSLDSVRQFDGVLGTEKVQRRADADWNAMLYTGTGSVSYERAVGQFSLRPVVTLDYYKLNEDAYREAGGGTGFDLTVRKRSSDELAVAASLAAGINFGGDNRYAQWSRIEIEGGRRERIAGALGRTTASFGSGTPFSLDPERRSSGWTGKVRAITGSSEVRLSGEVGAEQRLGDVALSARAALQFAF